MKFFMGMVVGGLIVAVVQNGDTKKVVKETTDAFEHGYRAGLAAYKASKHNDEKTEGKHEAS